MKCKRIITITRIIRNGTEQQTEISYYPYIYILRGRYMCIKDNKEKLVKGKSKKTVLRFFVCANLKTT